MKKILYPVVLVVILGIGVFLMYSIWGAVTPQSATQYFESGKNYYNAGKYPEAIVEFQNALQKDVRNRDARFFLAKSHLVQHDLGGAVKQLTSLLEYYPDDQDAMLQLGNIYLQGGGQDPRFFSQSKELAEKVLAKDPKNLNAMILMGNALAGLRDYTASVDQFEQALKLDPQNTSSLIGLGTTQAVQKNFPEAEEAFKKARELDPKNVSALLSLGSYYQAMGKNAEAEATLKDALAAHGDNQQVIMSAVSFYVRTGRAEQAATVLKDAQAKIPADPSPSMMLASLYRAMNKSADALTVLADAKSKFPQKDDVALAHAEVLFGTDRAAARKEVDAVLMKDPHNVAAQVLLGEMQFMSNEFDAAAATLNAPSIVNGRWPQAHLLLGQIEASKGQNDKALEHLQKALQLDAAYTPARLAMAELLLRMRRTDDAGIEAQKVLDVDRNSVQARLLKASVDAIKGKFADAEQEFADLQKSDPNNPNVHLRSGLYYQIRGKNADAEKSLLRALQLAPESDEILRQVTQYYVANRATDRALELINATVPDSKKRAVHYELIGLVNSNAARSAPAEAAFKKALQMEPDRIDAKAALASEYVNSKRYDEALQQLDQVIQQAPRNANALTTKGMIFQMKNDNASAKDSYDRALKIEPNSFAAANNLAYILAEEGKDLEMALGYAQTARRLAPEAAASADTLGWVQHKMGRDVLARDQLQFAVSKAPNNPTMQYHLGMIYKETKQVREAQAAFQKAVNSKEDFKEKALAQAALKELAGK